MPGFVHRVAETVVGIHLIRLKRVSIIVVVNLLVPFIADLSYSLECFNSKFLFDIAPSTDQPSDLAIAPNGDTYLVDGVNHRIMVFDPQGNLRFVFWQEGREYR